NRLASKPLLPEVAQLPLLRRHYSRGFLWKVNPRLLPQSERGTVFCDPINPELICQRVKENITGLINSLGQINFAMSAFDPTAKAASVKFSTAIAVDVKSLGNTLLP